MPKTCPSCAPPSWSVNVCETKSWPAQQAIPIHWHWRVYAGEIHVLSANLSGYGKNWYPEPDSPRPVLYRETPHGYTSEQISIPGA